jgi:high-affinity iron transporter
MFANLLIGLREGLEASLVVRWVTSGVVAALAVSIGVWAVITFTSRNMTSRDEQLFEGVLSIIAVAFVTWMILWMRKAARTMRRQLDGQMAKALVIGPIAVAATAFTAVAREGIETALFLWAAVRATGQGWQPFTGAALGIAIAVVIGYLIYRGAVRINLSKFFTWTGGALIVIAAGVLGYGVHELQEANVLPGYSSLAFDVSAQVPPDSWYGVLLRGTIGFLPETSWLHAAVWALYLVSLSVLFFRPQRRPATTAAKQPSAVA